MARLLLISNSGKPYLEHCRPYISSFLGSIQNASFISAAAFMDGNEYLKKVQDALALLQLKLEHLDLDKNPHEILAKASSIFVGGGNTYRLLKKIHEAKLMEPLRKKILDGLPYVGWSAGANIAGPQILTTNDWNVVGLTEFKALGLVPFNINPHYLETDPTMAQHSETRDMRIAEYHQVHENIVLGIEEQTSLEIGHEKIKVVGKGRVRRFERGKPPVDYHPEDWIPIQF